MYSVCLNIFKIILAFLFLLHIILFYSGKDSISPLLNSLEQNIRTFFFTSLKGSLTVEAALVLPLFLFTMAGVLQYGAVMKTAAEFGTALTQTGKKMAVTAYVSKYGGDTGAVAECLADALSAAYAQHEVTANASDTSMIKNANMLLSSFLEEDEMIDLALTYQIRSPVGMIQLPGTFFIQRAQVRAWTGRTPPKKNVAEEDRQEEQDMVYVTASGSVYHEDADCTHLKLSVESVFASQLSSKRNSSGGKYYACEKCGADCGAVVYITKDGDRYHSTLGCSGLKRTVRQISREEAANMKSCTRCGKEHEK